MKKFPLLQNSILLAPFILMATTGSAVSPVIHVTEAPNSHHQGAPSRFHLSNSFHRNEQSEAYHEGNAQKGHKPPASGIAPVLVDEKGKSVAPQQDSNKLMIPTSH